MSAGTLIALVYRTGKGCRQYPFHSYEDLEKFCNRKPYCNELLDVIPILDRCMLERNWVRAECVYDYVMGARNDAIADFERQVGEVDRG